MGKSSPFVNKSSRRKMAEGRPKWGPSPLDEGKRDLTITEKILGDIENSSPTVKALHSFMYTVAVAPVVWFRENVVEKVRGPEYNWYHRRYRRVPTIDECYFHDWGCRFEAQVQMERDKQVEEQIVQLLKYRAIDCANRERYMAVDQWILTQDAENYGLMLKKRLPIFTSSTETCAIP